MSRPSDHEFDTEFGGGLEAWHTDCAGLAWARLYAEAQRARSAEVELETKLREAESVITRSIEALGGGYSPQRVPAGIEEAFALAGSLDAALRAAEARAAKAERERDEAREALESAARAFVSVWAALGDRLLAQGPLARAYADDVSKKCRDAERACRAALGEKP